MKKLEILTALFMVSFIALWCVGFVTGFVYRCLLRRFYPEIASSIAPGLFYSIASDFAELRFLVRGDYRSIDRRGFVRLCDVYRVVLYAFVVAFGGFIVCVVSGGL